MVVAETQRLILKRFSLDDVDGFFELNNDPLVVQYTGDRPFDDRNQVRDFINHYDQYQKHGLGRWSVYLKATNQYLGFSGLRKSDDTGEVDIGFRLMRKYWNQGLATESAKACLRLAFDTYHADRVIARAMADNAASLAVINKLGMTYCENFMEDDVKWLKYELNRADWRD